MSSINSILSSKHKKVNSFSLDDCFGTRYLFVRSWDRWYNIAKCGINTDGKHIDDNDGLIPNAVRVHPEEVSYLLEKSEEYQEDLAKAEKSLRDYIEFREAWLRKPGKGGKVRLHHQKQKKEVAK